MPYQSPFVGLYWEFASFCTIVERLDEFLQKEAVASMEYVEERMSYMPVLRFAGQEQVSACAPHSVTPEELLSKWNRRKTRVSQQNCILKMQIHNEVELEWFRKQNFPVQIGFCGFQTEDENIIRIPSWELADERKKFAYKLTDMTHTVIKASYPSSAIELSYDAIKLLLGERNFNRCRMEMR